ncbi:MAG: hypothetical protein V3V00_00190 [Saprospiraceae bacterium]
MTIEDLNEFLEYFPEVTPPIILSIEEIVIYSRENRPLSQSIIQEVMLPLDGDLELDEFTEYIPCFKLKKENAHVPIVYYKAGLIKNEYHLLIISDKGKVLDSKALAGTFVKDDEMVTYIASIDEDSHIKVVIGNDEGRRDYYNPLNSQTISYDIAPDGKIILSKNNEE